MKSKESINSHLVYCITTESEIPYLEDLNLYSKSILGFTFEIWENKKKGWFSPKSYIKQDIDKYLICASKVATDGYIKELKKSGVNSSKIKKELFNLY